jgi:hypothetical protein
MNKRGLFMLWTGLFALVVSTDVAVRAATSAVVYERDYELFIVRADGTGEEERLTEDEDGDWDRRPTICPSGTWRFGR